MLQTAKLQFMLSVGLLVGQPDVVLRHRAIAGHSQLPLDGGERRLEAVRVVGAAVLVRRQVEEDVTQLLLQGRQPLRDLPTGFVECLDRGHADGIEQQRLDLLERDDELLDGIGDQLVASHELRLQQVLLEPRELQLQIAQRYGVAPHAREQVALRIDQCQAAAVELRQQGRQALLGLGVCRRNPLQLGEQLEGLVLQRAMPADIAVELVRPVLGQGVGKVLRQALQRTEEALADQQTRRGRRDLLGITLQAADGNQAGAGYQHQQSHQRGDQQVQPGQEAKPERG